MTYLEPKPPYTGLSTVASQLYGGIIPAADPEELGAPFIPQHNNALFRRKPLLHPYSIALPTPLLQLDADDHNHRLKRLIRRPVDAPRGFEFENRNLLIAQKEENANTIKLWTVDDNSTSNTLLQYNLSYKTPRKLHKPVRFRNTGSLKPSKTLKLPQNPIELKTLDKETVDSFLIRDVNGLKLCRSCGDEELEITELLKYQVKECCKIPYMNDIAVIDTKDKVFFGEIAEKTNLTRVKTEEPIRKLCPTDCPAELLLATKNKVFQTDFRVGQKNLEPIFNLDLNAETSIMQFSQEQVDYINDRECIYHLRTIDTTTEMFLVTSFQKIHAFDRRMPGRTVVSMSHFDCNGGDYTQVAGPFRDPSSQVTVYDYIVMNNNIRPSLSHWPLGLNEKEKIWSSMGPKSIIPPPYSVVEYSKRNFVSSPLLSDSEIDEIPKVPRGFYCEVIDESRGILFSQQNTGQIWMNNIVVSGVKEDSPEYLEVVNETNQRDQCVREVKVFVEEHSSINELSEAFSEELVMKKEDVMKDDCSQINSRIEQKHDKWMHILSQPPPVMKSLDDVLTHETTPMTAELAKLKLITEPKSEDHILSNIILKTVKKANDAWDRKYNPEQKAGPSNEPGPSGHGEGPVEQKVLDFEMDDEDYGLGDFDDDDD